MPNGLLLIDKPAGLRSAECVARVKRLVTKNTRVGHAGTLDSTASGLLVVLLGAATRLSDYVMKMPKTYEARVRLGVSTDTCDASGQIVFRGDAAKIREEAFDRVLCSFWGTRAQRPPEISALKVNGKPSHMITREGGEANLAPRPVDVTSARRCSPISDGVVRISVACGKGTYIRALVRDIGEALGCGAHTEELRRLSIGPFSVNEAQTPDSLADSGISEKLRSLREVGGEFHRVVLTADAEKKLSHGLCVPLAEAGRYVPGNLELRHGLCVEGEAMMGFADIALGEGRGGAFTLKPRVNVAVDAPK
ncbi:MAG: tRNA pseudouridine(55) synthase TruB [Synergistaceae bacterium]|nr:tRNA pseudouridine(55) synthase TruB [Synergistaceae bacterium]